MLKQPSHNKQIYTVTSLTREIKSTLEDAFAFVWVSGEISNLANPSSGHSYFTLKDDRSTIQGVLFRQQKKNLKFNLENGLKIIGMARLSVYEPRGSYQLIFEYLEPEGLGSCQIAFEQLKQKLSKNGLFDSTHKKKPPFLPACISVITSPTGAVIRDIIHVIDRRFPSIPIDVFPVKVQGNGASDQICRALELANRLHRSSVIILARGGGSLEDMEPFNSENVAMAVFNSDLPVISAIGHETDYTIADFVSDLRAPTPSAAAELAVPEKTTCLEAVFKLMNGLQGGIFTQLRLIRNRLKELESRLKTPKRYLDDTRLKLMDLELRLQSGLFHPLKLNQERLNLMNNLLVTCSPGQNVSNYETKTKDLTERLSRAFQSFMNQKYEAVVQLQSIIEHLNPDAILEKGYSITYSIPARNIVKNTSQVSYDDRLEIVLAKGKLNAKVIK